MPQTEHELNRESTIRHMHDVMGRFPRTDGAETDRTPPEIRVIGVQHKGKIEIRFIEYEAEPDDWVRAYLLIPDGNSSAQPNDSTNMTKAIIALHQTTSVGKDEPAGLGGDPELAYGLELAKNGYVVLVPDYPGFGDYFVNPYDLGYQSTTLKAVYNHMRGIDLLRAIGGVDAGKIGAIGHSLGGHNALFLAAFDRRVAVAASSCGFTSFAAYKGGDLSAWAQDKYMPRIASEYESNPANMPFDFSDVLQTITPRGIFISAPKHDSNFDNAGVISCLTDVKKYVKQHGLAGKIEAIFPDAKHSFPTNSRRKAYEFIGSILR